MGYTFKIGNAVPYFDKDDFPHLEAKWVVEGIMLDIAPRFPNDDMTENTNSRSPSYTAWHDFCRETGVFSIFYDEWNHLHAGHPGCIGITKEDADFVTAALARYRAKTYLPPGFESEDFKDGDRPNYDYQLARLMWLEFWMQWSVKNCETPAIQNT